MKRRSFYVRCFGGDLRRLQPGTARFRTGFSLIELLLAVALILILTTLLWAPRPGNRQRQLKGACQRNLERIYIAMELYANDCGGKFPRAPGAQTSEEALNLLVPRYSSDTAIFICPGGKDPALPPGEPLLKGKISYAYYMGRSLTNSEALMSDKQVNSQAKAAGQYAFSSTGQPPGDNHLKYGGNFIFCDGHIEQSPAQTPFALNLGPGVVLLNP